MKNIKHLIVLLALIVLVPCTMAFAQEDSLKAKKNEQIANGTLELVFILDRSGSMSGLEKDTIGGYNSFLDKQRKLEGDVKLTTVLFDHKYEVLHDRLNLNDVKPITDKEYYVRGSTALLDAIGKTILNIENSQNQMEESKRSKHVLFVITTDGMENASKEFSYEKIRKMIEQRKEEKEWEFIFLGANIDSAKTAEMVGISADRAANYHADSSGVQNNYETLGETVKAFRSTGVISKDWKKTIDGDFEKRK